MKLRVERFAGEQVNPLLPELARLRIEVFREFPYLYDGDAEYELTYLQTYARSPGSVIVIAFDDDRVIGASTGIPLADETDEVQRPFVAAGFDLDAVFYFGESVLQRAYRGHGLGGRFFNEREAHARELTDFRWTSFCAVERTADDPRRPEGYRPLDAFWERRGYRRHPELRTTFSWREIGETAESAKPMVFWLKDWHAGAV